MSSSSDEQPALYDDHSEYESNVFAAAAPAIVAAFVCMLILLVLCVFRVVKGPAGKVRPQPLVSCHFWSCAQHKS